LATTQASLSAGGLPVSSAMALARLAEGCWPVSR